MPETIGEHSGELRIASQATGIDDLTVDLAGKAVWPEIMLLIDASGSMNWANDGTVLAGCPVATTLKEGFATESRIRQTRAALELFQDRLREFSDGQVLVGVTSFPGDDLDCGFNPQGALGSGEETWSELLLELTPLWENASTFADKIRDVTKDGFYHSTPMRKGLETALSAFEGSDSNRSRSILLLSDGAFNLPAESQQEFLDGIVPALIDSNVRVFAIGFGETTSVDSETLQKLAKRSIPETDEVSNQSVFLNYNPEAADNEDSLNGFFTLILTHLLGLEISNDPLATIVVGTTAEHKALVTEHDSRVSFAIAWRSAGSERLHFELVAPDGTRIGPASQLARFRAGSRHKTYTVDVADLGPNFVGEWRLEVSYPASEIETYDSSERYMWDVITTSNLGLETRFDRRSYATGDSIVLEAELLERGRALTDQDVRLRLTRPDDGIGNWHAAHRVPLAVIQSEAAGRFNTTEQLSPAFLKHHYLTAVQGVSPPPRVTATGGDILLLDDGQGADRWAGDGIYTARLDGVMVRPGIYRFDVVATGSTEAGNSFRRQRVVQHYVSTRIDPVTTPAALVRLNADGNTAIYRAFVKPQDSLGNLLGPGFASDVEIRSPFGVPLNELTDDLEGGYSQDFVIAAGGLPMVEVNIGEVTLPPVLGLPGSATGGREIAVHFAFNSFEDGFQMEDGFTFGAGIGFRFGQRWLWGIESSRDEQGRVLLGLFRGDREFPAALSQKLVPYVTLGFGLAIFEDFATGEDVKLAGAFGGGLKVRLTDHLQARFELRALAFEGIDSGELGDPGCWSWQLGLGVLYDF